MAASKISDKKKEPWEDIPLEIIIEEKRKKEIEDRPRVYEYDYDTDYIPQKEEKKKKEPERGVWIIKMYS
jgi:hypothetical protein